LPPSQRRQIGLEALAQTRTVTELADEFDTSRKFVYQQIAIADRALEDAFAPQTADDSVLFCLPVTKQWLRQLVLGLVLVGHSPLRGVVELLRDLFDYPISLGSVWNIVHSAVAPAQKHNLAQDLSGVRVGLHDEIFQADQPVLVGTDALSTYCYLLSLEDNCDAVTWAKTVALTPITWSPTPATPCAPVSRRFSPTPSASATFFTRSCKRRRSSPSSKTGLMPRCPPASICSGRWHAPSSKASPFKLGRGNSPTPARSKPKPSHSPTTSLC
jgi:hypothetical protein